MQIFTLTAGRTGTAWLSEFLKQNLGFEVIHERLEIDDFGLNTPDIKIMRMFNEHGNVEHIQRFWQKKFETLHNINFGETNHTFGKCGLIENLVKSDIKDVCKIVVLRRNFIDQCIRYLNRRDFLNITIAWQWYLHPSYKKNLVNAEPFLSFGSELGKAMWYCYEMAVRQQYYIEKYSDRLSYIVCDLENITTTQGAKEFLSMFGVFRNPIIPDKKNVSQNLLNKKVQEEVRDIVGSIKFNPKELALDAISKNRGFDV